MQYRVFELGVRGNGPSKRHRLYIPSSRSERPMERTDFDIARFATPEEAAEAIEKDATYPGDCIIVACLS